MLDGSRSDGAGKYFQDQDSFEVIHMNKCTQILIPVKKIQWVKGPEIAWYYIGKMPNRNIFSCSLKLLDLTVYGLNYMDN